MKNISLKITLHLKTIKGTSAFIVFHTTKYGWCFKYIYNQDFYHSGLRWQLGRIRSMGRLLNAASGDGCGGK